MTTLTRNRDFPGGEIRATVSLPKGMRNWNTICSEIESLLIAATVQADKEAILLESALSAITKSGYEFTRNLVVFTEGNHQLCYSFIVNKV